VNGFLTAAIACACLLLAACGGTTKQASIRRSVAMQLASQSDAVAAALRRGESCVARGRALALRSHVKAAIAAGSIPAPLAPEARRASARLVSTISCTPPPPPPAVAPACAGIDEHAPSEAEKDGRGKREKGKSGHAHEKDVEQDRQRKGCE
jgi:hypothetical protein